MLDASLKGLRFERVDVAASCNILNLGHDKLGKQAKVWQERALNIYLKSFGPEHANVATYYNNLGFLHRRLGGLNQAKDCPERESRILT